MNDLRRELAPISDEAWGMVEQEATRTLTTYLAARKLVDFQGPHGWQHSAVNLGRVQPLETTPGENIEGRLRMVQPLVELRVPLELSRDELDSISRGAQDADLQPVIHAAQQLASAEDHIAFYGYHDAGMPGISAGSAHRPLPQADDFTSFPRSVAEALEMLREAGVGGPYAIALSPASFNALSKTAGPGGYPILKHVQRLIDGPIVWAPALQGALVLSLRGGDFELTVGRDISFGYLEHSRSTVQLYLEESLAFRLITPEAAVPISEMASK